MMSRHSHQHIDGTWVHAKQRVIKREYDGEWLGKGTDWIVMVRGHGDKVFTMQLS